MGLISSIQSKLHAKEFSCVELTRQYLGAISAENGSVNAYVRTTPELALEAAEKVDKKLAAGEVLAPLEGVPMVLKDNISTKEIETTCCSNILKGYTPIYNATVWQTLQAGGAVLLGKANMDEFAMGSACETSCFGGALNPRNTGYVAGGSSGGSAAAVCASLAAYGLGSDTGGSIRQPASFCGIVGLKPTYGAVSRYGLIAYASSLDQIGPLTATVSDAAAVFEAISGYDPMDSTCVEQRPSKKAALSGDIRGKKIGLVAEYFDGLSPEVKNAVMKAAGQYQAMGAELVELSIPMIKFALPAYYILACAEASSNLGRYDGIRYGHRAGTYADVSDMICKTRNEGFGTEVKRRIMLGTYVLSAGYYDAYYKKAQSIRSVIIRDFKNAFGQCDAILAPTAPRTAFERNATSSDPLEAYLSDICTVPVNIAGLPGISLPCGFDSNGLPIGIQLIGDSFDEATLLELAFAYEQCCPDPFKLPDMGVKLG